MSVLLGNSRPTPETEAEFACPWPGRRSASWNGAGIERRLADFSPLSCAAGGCEAFHRRTVPQAPEEGCDFDFLTKAAGDE